MRASAQQQLTGALRRERQQRGPKRNRGGSCHGGPNGHARPPQPDSDQIHLAAHTSAMPGEAKIPVSEAQMIVSAGGFFVDPGGVGGRGRRRHPGRRPQGFRRRRGDPGRPRGRGADGRVSGRLACRPERARGRADAAQQRTGLLGRYDQPRRARALRARPFQAGHALGSQRPGRRAVTLPITDVTQDEPISGNAVGDKTSPDAKAPPRPRCPRAPSATRRQTGASTASP